jgi:hypothetical protein
MLIISQHLPYKSFIQTKKTSQCLIFKFQPTHTQRATSGPSRLLKTLFNNLERTIKNVGFYMLLGSIFIGLGGVLILMKIALSYLYPFRENSSSPKTLSKHNLIAVLNLDVCLLRRLTKIDDSQLL